ncbi:MAG: tyrosine-protein phosphatase [Bacillus sp. (in: firmicutes)]
MIDIHSHILPGVDDGARTMEESLEIARAAVKQGITQIVASPHHRNGRYENEKQSILHKVKDLNDAISVAGIPLEVLPGQECRIYGELTEGLQQGEILTVNDTGKYVLVEFSSGHVPRYAEQLLYNIQFEGAVPIVVHPERNRQLMEHPEAVYELVERGVLMQVTAASIAGAFGKQIQKFSLQMVEANLVHFIASDAHNTSGRDFKMKEAFEVIEKKFGPAYVHYLQKNAEQVVQGHYIATEAPLPIKRKKFLGIF